jgi:hypothetical protein
MSIDTAHFMFYVNVYHWLCEICQNKLVGICRDNAWTWQKIETILAHLKRGNYSNEICTNYCRAFLMHFSWCGNYLRSYLWISSGYFLAHLNTAVGTDRIDKRRGDIASRRGGCLSIKAILDAARLRNADVPTIMTTTRWEICIGPKAFWFLVFRVRPDSGYI